MRELDLVRTNPLDQLMKPPILASNPDTVRIQEKLAHLEKSVTELSSVIYDHHKQIDKLNRLVDVLTDRIQSIQEEEIDSIPSDRPPHY